MKVAVPVVLSAEEREELERLARGRKVAVRVAERARIVLLASEGKQNQEIAEICEVTRRTVGVWRCRFAAKRISGILKDAPRAGRRRSIPPELVEEIVRKTTQETPATRTHWSTRSLAQVMGLSPSTIGRIWRSHGLKPHLARTFKLSRDRSSWRSPFLEGPEQGADLIEGDDVAIEGLSWVSEVFVQDLPTAATGAAVALFNRRSRLRW